MSEPIPAVPMKLMPEVERVDPVPDTRIVPVPVALKPAVTDASAGCAPPRTRSVPLSVEPTVRLVEAVAKDEPAPLKMSVGPAPARVEGVRSTG